MFFSSIKDSLEKLNYLNAQKAQCKIQFVTSIYYKVTAAVIMHLPCEVVCAIIVSFAIIH